MGPRRRRLAGCGKGSGLRTSAPGLVTPIGDKCCASSKLSSRRGRIARKPNSRELRAPRYSKRASEVESRNWYGGLSYQRSDANLRETKPMPTDGWRQLQMSCATSDTFYPDHNVIPHRHMVMTTACRMTAMMTCRAMPMKNWAPCYCEATS